MSGGRLEQTADVFIQFTTGNIRATADTQQLNVASDRNKQKDPERQIDKTRTKGCKLHHRLKYRTGMIFISNENN